MAKRKNNLNIDKIIKEKRGIGKGKAYKPGIKIQDFPSMGRVTRGLGDKTMRQHDFLSDLERDYSKYLEFADNVVDFREQFPLLPIEETIIIAKELGFEHPKNPKTKEPVVMTTDFLITCKDEYGEVTEMARTLKYKKDLLDKRVFEKFEIERQYFVKRGINWGIVTEVEIDKSVSNFIADLYTYKNIQEVDSFRGIEAEIIEDMKLFFINQCLSYEGTLNSLFHSFDKTMNMIAGSGIAMFKHLLISKIISINVFNKVNFKEHVDIIINELNERETSNL
jgi:hypothetical protein